MARYHFDIISGETTSVDEDGFEFETAVDMRDAAMATLRELAAHDGASAEFLIRVRDEGESTVYEARLSVEEVWFLDARRSSPVGAGETGRTPRRKGARGAAECASALLIATLAPYLGVLHGLVTLS